MSRHPILDERAALCDRMDELGPDAPTWSGDWTTADLAAHMVVRENRPDTLPGLVTDGAAARHTEKVRRALLASRSYGDIVDRLRNGPPIYWPGRFAPAFETHEWFVHHEDVRRPNGGEPRVELGRLDPLVRKALRMWGPRLTKGTGVRVVFRTPDGDEFAADHGTDTVTLTGPPGELLLRVFGRPVDVDIAGSDDAVRRFTSSDLGV